MVEEMTCNRWIWMHYQARNGPVWRWGILLFPGGGGGHLRQYGGHSDCIGGYGRRRWLGTIHFGAAIEAGR